MDLSSLSSKLVPGITTLGFREERRSRGECAPRPAHQGCPHVLAGKLAAEVGHQKSRDEKPSPQPFGWVGFLLVHRGRPPRWWWKFHFLDEPSHFIPLEACDAAGSRERPEREALPRVGGQHGRLGCMGAGAGLCLVLACSPAQHFFPGMFGHVWGHFDCHPGVLLASSGSGSDVAPSSVPRTLPSGP